MNAIPYPSRDSRPIPFTVVVPLLNEAESIPHLAKALKRLEGKLRARYVMHVILVDDGSSDDTVSTVNCHFAAWPNVELIRHPENLGIAQAIHTGLRAAATEFVCSLDADCTYDPLILEPMLQLLADGADLVTASPYHPQGQVRSVPAWRLMLSRGASTLYRSLLGTELHTFTSCCRAYRRSAVLPLPVRYDGFHGVAELMARVLLEGGTVVELPAVLEVRRHGRSKLRLLRTIAGHCGLLAELAAIRLKRAFDRDAPGKRLLRHSAHPVAHRHGTRSKTHLLAEKKAL